MYHFSNGISSADIFATAIENKQFINREYRFRHLEYPDVYIPNRSVVLGLSFMDEDSPTKKQLKESIEEYNAYLTALETIPGFIEFFIEHGLCVSRDVVEKRWSKEIAEIVFEKKSYIFARDLLVDDTLLFDKSVSKEYSVSIDGETLVLPNGKDADCYPIHCHDKRIIWNWVDNGHDFCFYLWELLGAPYRKNEAVNDDIDGDEVWYSFDAYDQIRKDCIEPQLVHIFQLLEKSNYIKTYTIKPTEKNPLWQYYGKTDGSIDCALVDLSFSENKALIEKIDSLLWTKAEIFENN